MSDTTDALLVQILEELRVIREAVATPLITVSGARRCPTIQGVAATLQFCELDDGHDGDHRWSKSYAEELRERVRAQ